MRLLSTVFVIAVALQFTAAAAQQAPVAGRAILGVTVDVKAVSAAGYRATKLLGSNVYNEKDERVGKVDDLIIAGDGQVTLAVLSVGGFLGLGARNVAIPVQLFKVGEQGKIQLPQATKDELKALPAFEYAR